jgi:hypothetical protein
MTEFFQKTNSPKNEDFIYEEWIWIQIIPTRQKNKLNAPCQWCCLSYRIQEYCYGEPIRNLGNEFGNIINNHRALDRNMRGNHMRENTFV